MDEKKGKLLEKINILNEYAARVKLPDETKVRIRRYLIANHQVSQTSMDQEDLLSELPSFLKAEVITHTHKNIIEKIKFF